MPIVIALPAALQPYAAGAHTLTLDAGCTTVADALGALAARWPAVHDRVMTEQGAVREHVNIFVGEESIRFIDGLATPVRDGDRLMIVAAVSGG
jgi:molybdopterin converting factor small subunit